MEMNNIRGDQADIWLKQTQLLSACVYSTVEGTVQSEYQVLYGDANL